jgi:hypothetical protein
MAGGIWEIISYLAHARMLKDLLCERQR